MVQGYPAFTTSPNSFQEGLKQCGDRNRSCSLILAKEQDKGSSTASDSMDTTWTVQKIYRMVTSGVDKHKEVTTDSMPSAK